MVDEVAPGVHLQRIRMQRGLSQRDLANAAGMSVSTVRKIEQGGQARIETFRRLAEVLNVETSALFGSGLPPRISDSQDKVKLDLIPLRHVLTPAVGLTGSINIDFGKLPADEQTLRNLRARAMKLYHQDDYKAVAAMLPAMIANSHALVRDDSVDSASALKLRAEIYQLAGWFCTQIRQYDLAYAAIRESMRDALESGDRLTAASGAISQAWLFIRQGRFNDAERLAETSASQVEPRLSTAKDTELAAWGWLLLRGSAAAVRNNKPDSSDEFLSLAEVAALRMQNSSAGGAYHQYWSSFNLRTVKIKRAEALMVVGDAKGALKVSEEIRLPKQRKFSSDNINRHLLDLAMAHASLRNFDESAGILSALNSASPEWLRHQRKARDVFRLIVRSRRRLPRDMQSVSKTLGLD